MFDGASVFCEKIKVDSVFRVESFSKIMKAGNGIRFLILMTIVLVLKYQVFKTVTLYIKD